jgi:hypothetical protein
MRGSGGAFGNVRLRSILVGSILDHAVDIRNADSSSV